MCTNSVFAQNLVLKVLVELGNPSPTVQQINLARHLLLTSYRHEEIVFHHKLSESEKNCLLLAAKGKTIQQTAHLLAIKTSTVTTLRKRALNKLGCRSMAHAVFIGLQYGYLSPHHEVVNAEKSKAVKTKNSIHEAALVE
jgi:DNA-binding CsgD family transcriptional regulator